MIRQSRTAWVAALWLGGQIYATAAVQQNKYGPFHLSQNANETITVETKTMAAAQNDKNPLLGTIDMKDMQGKVLFHRDVRFDDGGGSDIDLFAKEFTLPNGNKALLMIESWLPTAEPLGMYGQFYGFNSIGQFAPLSGRVFNNTNNPIFPISDKKLASRFTTCVTMEEWSGYFFALIDYPMNLNGFITGTIPPVSYHDTAVRLPLDDAQLKQNRSVYLTARKLKETPLTLYKEPRGNRELKVTLKPASAITFLGATRYKDHPSDVAEWWLKVKIENNTGYVKQAAEEFAKLGFASNN